MSNIKPPFLNLSKTEQKMALEALLFSAEETISLKYIFDILIANNIEVEKKPDEEQKSQISINQEIMNKFDVSPEYFKELIQEINIDLIDTNRPYHIVHIADGYQFATRSEYGELIHKLTNANAKRKFSQASLEALSIIAYKQPVTKPEIEQIRGVNSNEIVNSLLEKKLVKIVGRKDVLGKPLLYGTTKNFLKIFGLKSIEELPKLREIEEISSSDTDLNQQIELTIDVSDPEYVDELQKRIDNDYQLDSAEIEQEEEENSLGHLNPSDGIETTPLDKDESLPEETNKESIDENMTDTETETTANTKEENEVSDVEDTDGFKEESDNPDDEKSVNHEETAEEEIDDESQQTDIDIEDTENINNSENDELSSELPELELDESLKEDNVDTKEEIVITREEAEKL